MNKPKILFIGFESWNEKMYPHTFDFLWAINKHFEITYYGGDDRGLFSRQKEINTADKIKLLLLGKKLQIDQQIQKVKSDIKSLLKEDYDLIIVIDHSAINYVCSYKKKKTKLIFWSQDILSRDHPWIKSSPYTRDLIGENRKNINSIDGIIVQDENRARLLDETIYSFDLPKFFLPVSTTKKSESLSLEKKHNKINGKSTLTLMQIGSIYKTRLSDQLVNNYQHLGDNIKLVLLGFIQPEISAVVAKKNRKPEIISIRNHFLEMQKEILKADIGVIGVGENNLNTYYYKNAAGQCIEFLKFGIPVIIVGQTDLGDFAQKNEFGIHISHMNDLDKAIHSIISDYTHYSQKSHLAFEQFYNFDLYKDGLIDFINQIIKDPLSAPKNQFIPSIDVVIPVYNGEKFIIDALQSVITQSFKPHKIMIIDDGSTDNTVSRVNKFSKKLKIHIEVISKKHGGLSSARNEGIRNSQSDYIAFLDSDDMWNREKLQKQYNAYKKNHFRNLGLVYSDYTVIDEQGNNYTELNRFKLDAKLRGSCYSSLFEINKVAGSGSAVLVKRSVFNRVGLFDENLKAAEDWDMWLRIAKYYELDYVPNILVKIRRHSNSMQSDFYNTFHNKLQFYKKWIKENEITNEILEKWYDDIIFCIYYLMFQEKKVHKLFKNKDILVILYIISRNVALFSLHFYRVFYERFEILLVKWKKRLLSA